MPKVDLPEGFGVGPSELEAPVASAPIQAFSNQGQGLQQFGSAVSGDLESLTQAYRQHQEREGTAMGANMVTTYQHRLNTDLSPNGGLMSQRGDQALAASEGLSEGWQKARDDIAKGATNDYAKRYFLMHSGVALDEAQKQADSWVGHQRLEAQESAVNGAQAIALQTIRQSLDHPGIDTAESVARAIAQPEQPTAALQLSPEARTAAVSAWQQKAHSTVLEHYIDDASNPDSATASSSVAAAKTYFADHKEELGSSADHYQKVMNLLGTKETGDQTALSIINSSRKPDSMFAGQPVKGFVDLNTAITKLEAMPAGPDKEKAIQSFDRYSALEKQREENIKKSVLENALKGYDANKSLGDVPPETELWLKNNYIEGWQKLEQDDRTERRVARTSDSQERRDEATRQKTLLDTFKGMDTKDQATANLDSIFVGQAPSPETKALMGMEQKKAKAIVQKGEAPSTDEFKSTVAAKAAELGFTGPSGKKTAAALLSSMTEWREAQLQKSGGVPPTREDVEKQFAKELVYGNKGWFGGGKYLFQAEQKGEAFTPAGAEDQKYRPPPLPVAPTAPAPRPVQVRGSAPAQLPAGVKKGADGNPYQKNQAGKWVPYHG